MDEQAKEAARMYWRVYYQQNKEKIRKNQQRYYQEKVDREKAEEKQNQNVPENQMKKSV
jgi:hypothetical protein